MPFAECRIVLKNTNEIYPLVCSCLTVQIWQTVVNRCPFILHFPGAWFQNTLNSLHCAQSFYLNEKSRTIKSPAPSSSAIKLDPAEPLVFSNEI